ncbi:Gfo/Idh/MocA family oxidoreductase [Candidatus Stoquefichus sp. SB1]|uniref:Gfo/Idh/MocA family oxidoreductase n=1 Tax=Candidatus Stoquefichus sp. SB1 TaxID=1658109 RepID=UPI00067EDC52|nr:Gfo/Idh/MocA family oxidoreductase [Candidatus Stoquefichus sp. SB1]
MIDHKLVIGYIGNGKSANRYHLPFVMQRKDKFIVKTIFDIQVRHDVWDEIEGVHYTENVDDILNDPEIDMVVICTTHHLHYEYAKKVLNAHKHCLVEKPFMETSEQAKEIFALADQFGLYCSAYQNRRYDSDFLTVQKVIESGKLGDLLEIEMHYDYYRPEVPESIDYFDPAFSYLYGHGCHTLDQVISYFGKPDDVHYDVRQLLGTGRMNDYFDIDMYYGTLKISVKSSYFRVKERPSFVVYGKKGMFVKQTKDRQEEHLKLFHMPTNDDFGLDTPDHFGVLTYYDEQNVYHEEKIPTIKGDYARVYDGIYDCIVHGKEQVIKHEQTLLQIEMLETGVGGLK